MKTIYSQLKVLCLTVPLYSALIQDSLAGPPASCTHLIMRGRGTIVRWPSENPDTPGFPIPKERLSRHLLYLCASNSGNLAYLEEAEQYCHLRYLSWCYAEIETQVNSATLALYPYAPEELTYVLHILNKNGQETTTRPVSLRYQAIFDTIGFRGDRYALLQTWGRLWGLYDETIVDLQSDRKYMLSRAVHGEWIHSLSPDGQRLATVIADTHTTGSMILIDGIQVYPLYDARPALASESPKDFLSARHRITAWMGQRKVAPLSVSQLSVADSNWSADGQRLAFLVQRHGAQSLEGKSSATLDLLVIYVAAIGPNRGTEDYTTIVPTDVALQLASDDREHLRISWDSQSPEIVIQRERQPSFSRRYAAPVP